MSIAVNCINDLITKVSTVATVGAKIFSVYSEDDLLDKSKLMTLPAVGILYEGMTESDDPSRQGMMAQLRVAVVVLFDGKTIGNLDRKNEAADLLDEVRRAIRMTAPSTGHKWRFVSETPVGVVSGVLVYIQRWSTAVALTN